MSRNAPFDEHVARGLLKVIGQAGQLLDQTRGTLHGESPTKTKDEARSTPPSQRVLQGDLAARRLFSLMEQADQGEAGEPLPAEAPAVVEPPPPVVEPPPPVEPPSPAEPPPVVPRSVETRGLSAGVPEPNPWCLAVAESDKPPRRSSPAGDQEGEISAPRVDQGVGDLTAREDDLAQWLKVQLASACPTKL